MTIAVDLGRKATKQTTNKKLLGYVDFFLCTEGTCKSVEKKLRDAINIFQNTKAKCQIEAVW